MFGFGPRCGLGTEEVKCGYQLPAASPVPHSQCGERALEADSYQLSIPNQLLNLNRIQPGLLKQLIEPADILLDYRVHPDQLHLEQF